MACCWGSCCTFPAKLTAYRFLTLKLMKNKCHILLSEWTAWLQPSRSLKPSEIYCFRLYLCQIMRQLSLTLLMLGIAYGTGAFVFWHDFPARRQLQAIFQHPHRRVNAHSVELFITFFVILFIGLPVLIGIVFAVYELPRYYFWNRQATQIADADASDHSGSEIATNDSTSWPPPPSVRH